MTRMDSNTGRYYHADMSLADEIREEATTTGISSGRYACWSCGIPLEHAHTSCPECSETAVVPIEKVMSPEFAD